MSLAIPSRKLILLSGLAPNWVLRAGGIMPAVDIDFVNRRAWVNGLGVVSLSSLLSITRASQETYTDASGNLSYTSSGALAIGNAGLQVWEARTNVVLWNNDLTNAAWTKSNVTAALDQTGPDNVLNSASSILATAGNATILQVITLGSSARFQSAYVKRITGSGTINMTMDNGSTWTAVTTTAGWTRVSIPTQTLANPTVGFQIVTNGDKIAVALFQNENGTFDTPGIPTTSGTVARAADNVNLIGVAGTVIQGYPVSFVAQVNYPNTGAYANILAINNGGSYWSVNNDTTVANGVKLDYNGAGGGNESIANISSGSNKIGVVLANGNSQILTVNGAAPASMARTLAATGGLNSFIGRNRTSSGEYANTDLKRLTLWNVQLSSNAIKAATQ